MEVRLWIVGCAERVDDVAVCRVWLGSERVVVNGLFLFLAVGFFDLGVGTAAWFVCLVGGFVG